MEIKRVLGTRTHTPLTPSPKTPTHPSPKTPQIQKKLKMEIKRVLGNRTDITPEDLAQLSYAKNCFQESLRIYSVVPHVTRVCMRDTVSLSV